MLCLIIQELSRPGALLGKSLSVWGSGGWVLVVKDLLSGEGACVLVYMQTGQIFLVGRDAPRLSALKLSVPDSFLSPQGPSTHIGWFP